MTSLCGDKRFGVFLICNMYLTKKAFIRFVYVALKSTFSPTFFLPFPWLWGQQLIWAQDRPIDLQQLSETIHLNASIEAGTLECQNSTKTLRTSASVKLLFFFFLWDFLLALCFKTWFCQFLSFVPAQWYILKDDF